MLESGLITKWIDEWVREQKILLNYGSCSALGPIATATEVKVLDFQGALILLAFGLFVAICTLLIEVIVVRRVKKWQTRAGEPPAGGDGPAAPAILQQQQQQRCSDTTQVDIGYSYSDREGVSKTGDNDCSVVEGECRCNISDVYTSLQHTRKDVGRMRAGKLHRRWKETQRELSARNRSDVEPEVTPCKTRASVKKEPEVFVYC